MRIALAGFGTVGRALAELVLARGEALRRHQGLRIDVVLLIGRTETVSHPRGLPLAEAIETKKAGRPLASIEGASAIDGQAAVGDLLVDHAVDALVEASPTDLETGGPALARIRAALIAKRHVVTATKGPVALAFPALLDLARHNGVRLLASGSVGGGTPFIDFAQGCLAGNRATSFRGILNGTTNYILTRMADEGTAFEAALRGAQEAGYAEADPRGDVDGWDAAAKCVILANLALGRRAVLADVAREGIAGVTAERVRAAIAAGRRVKLIARADESGLSVRPEEVAANDPVCVSGALNAVTFETPDAGPLTLVGKGAGGPETATAILRDLFAIKREYEG
ncbi:MAG: homoserine dehydrogenase [Planctomycetota bacterium]